MKLVVQRLRQRTGSSDAGMTLIEVIVAISLIAIISTGAIGLGIASQKGSSIQQRQEIAVTVASEAMEAANAQSSATNPSTQMSYLYQGRTQSQVTDAWTANAGAPGLAATYPGWDPSATATSVQSLRVSQPVVRNGTVYTVYTLIGTCYISTVGSGDCTTLAGSSTPPAVTPVGKTQLSRVLIIVRWNAGGCVTGGCSYQAGSLIDAHSDLQWNTHA